MDKAEIKEKLLILGIVDFKQFKEGDLRYWWQLKYKELVIRSKKSRSRDSNRFFARRELCNQVSEKLGIPTKDDIKIKKAIMMP